MEPPRAKAAGEVAPIRILFYFVASHIVPPPEAPEVADIPTHTHGPVPQTDGLLPTKKLAGEVERLTEKPPSQSYRQSRSGLAVHQTSIRLRIFPTVADLLVAGVFLAETGSYFHPSWLVVWPEAHNPNGECDCLQKPHGRPNRARPKGRDKKTSF